MRDLNEGFKQLGQRNRWFLPAAPPNNHAFPSNMIGATGLSGIEFTPIRKQRHQPVEAIWRAHTATSVQRRSNGARKLLKLEHLLQPFDKRAVIASFVVFLGR